MLQLVPAFGDKYENADAAKNAWFAGRDFKIYGGPYCSCRDMASIIKDYNGVVIHWDFPYTNSSFAITTI